VTHKTALVLSAGGMFGSYQAGVWSELCELVKPDFVVGASIGSINGYLIASGCTAAELVSRWMDMKGADVRWRMPRRLSEGIIDSSGIHQLLQTMFNEHRPRIPFGVVATEFRTMTPKLFMTPDVSWEHVAASCAVPLFLRQPSLDGRFHADGGLINPLPMWAAVQMGATRVISVNVLKHRPLVVRAAASAARLYSRYRDPDLSGLRWVNISPPQPLGEPRDTIYWSRSNAERWIELGKRDASRSKHLVVECLEQT
jgi:NTE family protein